MVLCNKNCIPCCDFCIHAIHDEWMEGDKKITGGPIGCKEHKDEEHQKIAESCGYCPDFHCFRANEENQIINYPY